MKKRSIIGILTFAMMFSFMFPAGAAFSEVPSNPDASIIVEPYSPEDAEIMENSETVVVAPEKVEYLDDRGSIILQSGSLAPNDDSIVVEPENPVVITRAKETFPISSWKANQAYTLSSDKEMQYGEKIKVEGSWNNPGARMSIRCSVRKNGRWSIVSSSSFASGYSTTLTVAATGLILVEAVPNDDIGSGSLAIYYNV